MATELFTAIKGGDKATVERLLERDRALVDARDETGLSPILAALYRGQGDIATAILRRQPRLTLFEAAAAGDDARVREIVARDPAQANAVAPFSNSCRFNELWKPVEARETLRLSRTTKSSTVGREVSGDEQLTLALARR